MNIEILILKDTPVTLAEETPSNRTKRKMPIIDKNPVFLCGRHLSTA